MDEDKRYDEYGLTNDDDYGFSLTNDDEGALTGGDYDDGYDERPLVSGWSDDDSFDDAPLDSGYDTRPVSRPASSSRKETINRLASEHQNGVVRTKGLRTAPDPRRAAGRLGKLEDRYQRKTPRRDNHTRAAGSPNVVRRPIAAVPPSGTYKKRKSMFAAFYIVLILMGVGAFLTVSIVVAQNFRTNPPENIFAVVPTPTPAPEISLANRADLRHMTGLITAIAPLGDTRTITLMDVSTRRSEDFIVGDARLSTRLNMPMTFAELRVGHMVDISFDSRTLEVDTLNESVHSWERRGRTNIEIDIEGAIIHVGHESFNFNSQTLVLYRGEAFLIGEIRPVDSVTVVGIGDTAWLVQIDAAHGFLQFQNSDIVMNGTVMIGTNLFFALDDIETSLTLPEGMHRVVVEGDNIETFVTNITIEQGQTTGLNLGDVELRTALLQLIVTPADADVFLNGELHDLNEGPAQVEFGELHIRVERYGFVPQEERIEITTQINSIPFNLVEIVIDSTLVIFTDPTNAQVFIDNVFVGYSVLTHTVAPGERRVIVRMAGFEDSEIIVNIPPGEESHQHLLLTPSPASTPPPQPPIAPPGELPDVPPENPFPNDPPIIPIPTPPPLPPTLPPGATWPPTTEPVPTPTPPPTWSPGGYTDDYSDLPDLPDDDPFL